MSALARRLKNPRDGNNYSPAEFKSLYVSSSCLLILVLCQLMPRLAPKYLAQASREHYLLPLLLRPCRDLQSARLELKWLRDHALNQAGPQNDIKSGIKWKYLLHELCTKRSRGVPLQYLLGTEYFGDIEIACRPGVLIPR